MSKIAKSKVARSPDEVERFIAALRYLQHEASQASLDGVVVALARAERAVCGQISHDHPSAIEAATEEEAEMIEHMVSPSGAGRAERRFRLQALTEVSTSLTTEQLIQFAYVCDVHATHLISFLQLFTSEPEALSRA